jgi:hypothetical protein
MCHVCVWGGGWEGKEAKARCLTDMGSSISSICGPCHARAQRHHTLQSSSSSSRNTLSALYLVTLKASATQRHCKRRARELDIAGLCAHLLVFGIRVALLPLVIDDKARQGCILRDSRAG